MTLAVVGSLGVGGRVQAQTYTTVMDWDQLWRYDQSGRELGTAWRAVNYTEDANWQGLSPGLLGYEPDTPGNYTRYENINTALVSPANGGPTTIYFRTTFSFSGGNVGLSLVASNLIDDGAVIYLNGTEVGRFRVATGQNSTTFASDQTSEGTIDVLTITNLALLRQGQNVMAVEVHQNSLTSSDVMYGMKLVSIRSSALTITSQPQSQFVVAGEPLVLSVGVSGAPAFYRWFKNGTFVTGATNFSFTATPATTNNEGNYFVVVTNILTALTSSVATVSVLPDTVGPRVIDALGTTNTRGAQVILISFTEPLTPLPSTNNPLNFVIYAGTNYSTRITYTNIAYSFTDRPRVTLFPSGPGWFLGSNYFIVVNNVVDSRGNVSFPNIRVPVGWQILSNLTQMSDFWNFHDSAVFDPTIYDANPPWYATNYSIASSGWWGTGQGIFFIDNSQQGLQCAGDTLIKEISFQVPPTLFRRSFVVPPGSNTNGTLRLRFIVDDGMILYLNGKEVYLYNSRSGPVSAGSRALASTDGMCITNVELAVSNLVSGVNYIAAAICQFSDPSVDPADTMFGLEMDYVTVRLSPLPADPPPDQCRLTMTKQGSNLRFSWSTNFSGLGLQYKTNLDSRLPWITVSNQALPFLTPIGGQTRLYRLYNYK